MLKIVINAFVFVYDPLLKNLIWCMLINAVLLNQLSCIVVQKPGSNRVKITQTRDVIAKLIILLNIIYWSYEIYT